jgi:hypothetical protein
MEINEAGEIVKDQSGTKLMGKFFQKRQEKVEETPKKVVEEKVEPTPSVEKTEETPQLNKEQVAKIAFLYLDWTELMDLAKLKIVDLEKENVNLTQLLKQVVLKEQKEQ